MFSLLLPSYNHPSSLKSAISKPQNLLQLLQNPFSTSVIPVTQPNSHQTQQLPEYQQLTASKRGESSKNHVEEQKHPQHLSKESK
jgi:hypothetical protein